MMDEIKIVRPQGDPRAPEGTAGWANLQRILLLSATDAIVWDLDQLWSSLEAFLSHRGWSVIEKEDGTLFRSFSDFVTTPRPFGLGQSDYQAFRLILASKVGEERLGRLVVDEPGQAGRPTKEESENVPELPAHSPKATESRDTRTLSRAINRAPECIQTLYDAGLLRSDYAAKFGPDEPSEEAKAELGAKAKRLAEEAETLEEMPEPKRKREVNRIARDVLGVVPLTRVERILREWRLASDEERAEILAAIGR